MLTYKYAHLFYIGCSNGHISVAELANLDDTALTASSAYSSCLDARYSRLFSTSGKGSWASLHNSVGQWMQAPLTGVKVIVKVSTQGRYLYQFDRTYYDQYVTSYKLSTSTDGIAFEYILDLDGSPQIFSANVDNANVVENAVDFVQTLVVRLEPLTWYAHISVR